MGKFTDSIVYGILDVKGDIYAGNSITCASTGAFSGAVTAPIFNGVATKVSNNLIIQLNGGTTEGTNKTTFNGETSKTINITPSNIGAVSTSGSGASGTWGINISGNATSATRLQTARSINGTNFDGSANITTSNWGTARNLTIGSTAKSVNGSANVAWTLAEIGAAPTNHTHTFASLTGKPNTLSGYGITDAPTKTGGGASGTWGISISGNAATASSANAVAWSKVSSKPNTLSGYGITDAPTKTGGGASGTWGISVTGHSQGITSISTSITSGAGNRISYSYNIKSDTTGLFPATNNANAVMTVNTHGGEFWHQLGFSSNGRLYSRMFAAEGLGTSRGWNEISFASHTHTFASLTSKPNTLSGYGITDAPTKTGGGASGTWGISISGNAATASSANAVAWSKVSSKPTTLSGYGITDAPTKTGGGASGTWGISISGNAATASSANAVAWGNVSGKPTSFTPAAHTHSTVDGIYTGNGGQQQPSYIGLGKVRFNMMNTPINGNGNYKNFLLMDCYSGNDVGGASAIGVDRSSMAAFIMRSDADRKAWNQSAELLHTSNYNNYAPTKTGSGASGTWGISISGNAASASSVAWSNVSGKPTSFTPAAHTHTFASLTSRPNTLSGYGITDAPTKTGGGASGTWGISISGNTSGSSSRSFGVDVENSITYGRGGLQFAQASASGSGLNGSAPSLPVEQWHHSIILNHSNGHGYYTQLSTSFFSDEWWSRRVTAGAISSWVRFWTSANLNNTTTDFTCRNLNVVGSVNQTSSINYKTDIVKFEQRALDIIEKVNVVNYKYKTHLNVNHIGFIAEDTPKELSTDKQNVMDIGSCVGVLLKAVQELTNEIKQIKNE